jgi:hypothetical protein
MASHIATEEWQSFELRMRRRRAERLVARAEAALQIGSIEDARNAIDEARRLCPALPSIEDVEAKVAHTSGRTRRVGTRAGARRGLAIAAGLIIVATSGALGWRTVRTHRAEAATHETPSTAAVTPVPLPSSVASSNPSAPAPAAEPSIRIETKQVPPVVISGATTENEKEAAPPAVPPPPRTLSASASTPPPPVTVADSGSRAIGTSGPTAPAPAQVDPPAPSPVDRGAIAAVGNETSMPPPAVDRFARLKELAKAADDPAPAPVDRSDPVAAAPPPSAPAAASPTPSTPADDAVLVRSILDKYAEAYTRLDADAAKAVWPSVNRAALSRAFNGLNEQRIAFNDCSVNVRSTEARATCSGSTTWEPKIGGGPHTDTRRWAFDLEKSADGWIIRDARVQNR